MTAKPSIALDQYDKATMALTGITCATGLLMEGREIDIETRDWLLATIFDNAAECRRQLDISLRGEVAR